MIEMKNLSVNLEPTELLREDDSEKYLFSNKKTIGFRKDKKLYKFVGLRDGDDKQFELTLNSINIDDSEKIASNRLNFTSLKEENGIIHNINELEIISDVNETTFQNFIKVEEQFTNIEIIYELHLTNLSYKEKNGIYLILDSNNSEVFTIDKPIAKDVNGDVCEIVEHTIYEEDDKIYYKKFINNNIITEGYPFYIDITVTYGVSSYGLMRSSNTLPSTDPRSVRWQAALDGTETINKIASNDTLSYNIPSSSSSCRVDRYFTLFNTTGIGQNDEIITAKLTVHVADYATRLVVHQGTADNYNSLGWETFNKDVLLNGVIIDQSGSYTFDVRNAINKSNYTSFFIRMYDLDYLGNTPSLDSLSTIFDNLSFSLVVYYKGISETKTFKFDLESNGTGVLSSTAADYGDAIEGTNVSVVHTNINTSYSEAVLYDKDESAPAYRINRTYLCFDTRQLSPYLTDTVDNIEMRLVIPNNDNFSLTLMEGKQNGDAPLGDYNWSERGRRITEIPLTPPDDDILVTMNRSAVEFDDYTTFILVSTVNDYEGQESDGQPGDVTIATEIDFSEFYLEIDIQSHKVYGQTYKKVEYNTNFTLTTYANTDSGVIKWFDDSEQLNEIGSGETITLQSKVLFDNGIRYIYSILENGSNNRISNNVLEIRIDVFNYEYDSIPTKDNNVVPMSLDTVYFKNYSCLNGVCFVYARIVEEVYEENIYVSDGYGNGAYNLYSEYDSIDEFYDNIYEVDVAIDYNIDITRIYNRLDSVTLVEGSRLLLFKQDVIEENGIYLVANNGTITRTDEMSTEEEIFRAKVNVKAGTYLDSEFHTFK